MPPRKPRERNMVQRRADGGVTVLYVSGTHATARGVLSTPPRDQRFFSHPSRRRGSRTDCCRLGQEERKVNSRKRTGNRNNRTAGCQVVLQERKDSSRYAVMHSDRGVRRQNDSELSCGQRASPIRPVPVRWPDLAPTPARDAALHPANQAASRTAIPITQPKRI